MIAQANSASNLALSEAEDFGTSPSPSESFESGTVLQDTFRIVKPLAAGGMGEVFLATHERVPGLFAIKALHREMTADAEAFARFRNEAHVMAGLRHPNVVSVVDFNVTPGGTPYLVMEYLEGSDLGEIIRTRGALPPAQVGAVVRQVASALDAAHARGIVHRDLKPENVVIVPVVGQDDLIKVIDFGISKSRWSARITMDDRILGTPQFMAPEQALGRRDEVGEASDQFSLAVMTYMMLSGESPWLGDEALAILYRIVHEEAPRLSARLPWVKEVDKVLQKALSKEPSARYPSVIAFAQAFEAALSNDVPGGPQPLDLYVRPVVPTPDKGFPRTVTPASIRPAAPSTTVRVRRRLWPQVAGVLVLGSLLGSGVAVGVAANLYGWPAVVENLKKQGARAANVVRARGPFK